MDDNDIVDLFLKRDEMAIKAVEMKYGIKLNRIAQNILENKEDAKECENDTYLDAWRIIPPNEPRKYLFSFLGKIIRNKALNYCKSKNTLKRKVTIVEFSKELEECIASPNLETDLKDNEIGAMISYFLRKEKQETRIIFIRRYWYMDSISDIANKFDISESKVKSILFRTRNKLRFFLEKEGYKI